MTSAEMQTIFLVNQISKHGHLDLYARLYSLCLLNLGYRVVLIAQEESGISEWIAANCRHHLENFIFYSRGELGPLSDGTRSPSNGPIPPIFARIQRVWRKEGMAGLFHRICLHGR